MIAAAALFVSRHFRWLAWLVYAALAAERIGSLIRDPSRIETGRDWSITFYFANYVDHGFARRGLLGTVLRPLVDRLDDPFLWILGIMAALNLVTTFVLIEMVARRLPHREDRVDMAVFLRVAMVIGSGGVMQLMNEHGALDQVNYLLLILALALLARGRGGFAGLVAAAAILVHEAFAVFALPLLLSAALLGRDATRLAIGVAVPAGSAIIAVLLFGGSDAAQSIPHGIGQVAWRRGLFETEDTWHLRDLLLTLWYWVAIGAVLRWWWRDNGRTAGLYYLAALSPLALNLLGTDHPRWIGIGVVTALIAICHAGSAIGTRPARLTPARAALALILVLPFGPLGQAGLHPWLN